MIRLTIPEIGEEEIQAVVRVLRSGYLVQGSQVQEFERLVAEYVGVKHAIAVSSGTAALHLALLALGIGPNDEVIVPDFTFPATANVVELIGAKPILVDIDLATFNVNASQIGRAITPRTRAIMPVHLFGQSADMRPILEIAQQHDLPVVEDAACALGAEYGGRKCGSMGQIGCFSFHPRKAITTGEGGVAVTNDDAIAARLAELRNHGIVATNGHNQFHRAGFNYRMTDFQGALGVTQMKRLDSIISRRRELAELYGEALARIPSIGRPLAMEGALHIWQSYVVLAQEGVERDRLLQFLRAREIETTIGTYAVGVQAHYARKPEECPNSYHAYTHSLCLPLHSRMSAADVEIIVQALEHATLPPRSRASGA